VFCYGQTGSGKTHTMYGKEAQDEGVVQISIETMFSYVEAVIKLHILNY
jgi:hypothetical protein